MRIIISPAKKMHVDTDSLPVQDLPVFLDDTKVLCRKLQEIAYEQAKALWKCNDKLTQLNRDRIAHMDLENGLTPAVLAYEGLQYQHMAPMVFTDQAFSYLDVHLRILSGFYGVLRPFDGVVPYRLEMQAKLAVGDHRDLYGFWGDRLYRELMRENEDGIILNLASKEYARVAEPYVSPEDHMITVVFGELADGKVKQKGTFAKMARGEMVRFLAEHQITDVDEMKQFCALGLSFQKDLSDEKTMVFAKNE